jgi:hypothetical protein
MLFDNMFPQNIVSGKISVTCLALKFGEIVNFNSMGQTLNFTSKCFTTLLTLKRLDLEVNSFIVPLAKCLQKELFGAIFTLINILAMHFIDVVFKLK